jgi:hypothetical protein
MDEFKDGSAVTVIRGKGRGPATVIAKSTNGEYAVRTGGGDIALVKADNLKEPAEPTITEGVLTAALQVAINEASRADEDAQAVIRGLVEELEVSMPGLGGRLSWPNPSRS